jgi:JmjC domain
LCGERLRVNLAAVSDDSLLDTLVAPLKGAELREAWNKRAFHVPAGENAAKKIASFQFSSAAFHRAAARIPAPTGGSIAYGHPVVSAMGAPSELPRFQRMRAQQIDDAYASGLTCQLGGLQFLHGPCGVAADRLRRELNHPGNVHFYAFLSPRASGARMHFDRSPGLTIQLEGSKTWRYAKAPSMDEVPEQTTLAKLEGFRKEYPWASPTPPRDDELLETTLYPGDVLHVPAGTWHEASAGDHSLAIAIELDKRPLADVIVAHLRGLLMRQPQWRRTPPPVDAHHDDAQAVVDSYVDWCDGRVRELQELVAGLSSVELVSACYPQLFGGAEARSSAERTAPADADAGVALSPDDELTVPFPLGWSPDSENDGTQFLLLSSRAASASLGLGALPLVQRLLEVTTFRAGEARTWFGPDAAPPWEEIQSALDGLLTARILARR